MAGEADYSPFGRKPTKAMSTVRSPSLWRFALGAVLRVGTTRPKWQSSALFGQQYERLAW